MPGRAKIPIAVQVEVFYGDRWLCHWCGRPTLFPLALKYLDRFLRDREVDAPLAYYDLRYRRDAAPLLDELAAVVDHMHAHSRGGADSKRNLVTACNKCNARKRERVGEEFRNRNPSKRVKARYGEPKHWDGLVSVFMVLAESRRQQLTANERAWYRALREYLLRTRAR
jgi:5-methylcytosine-specific restriction endonuclease McrA